MIERICPQCGAAFRAERSRVNRAVKTSSPVYCGRACAGLGRRLKTAPTEAERKAAKAEYDRLHRAKNENFRKQQKAEYFQRTYDPAKAAIERKARAHLHAEYCRQPEYKAWKKAYDRRYRAAKDFGEFADAAIILQEIETEVLARATRYEIGLINATINKAQRRRRSL